MRLVAGVLVLLACASCLGSGPGAHARVLHLGPAARDASPRILCVVAHPDDEIAFAGTLYKSSTLLGAACDVLVITNGEGGFKYATLAEPVYGLELGDETIGRAHLPAIRERELAAGCRLLGVRDLFWLGQQDLRYTLDPEEVLGPGSPWDLEHVRHELRRVLERGDYGFVLTLAPDPDTHGHHKAATCLALEAAAAMPVERRPVVLCARGTAATEPRPEVPTLAGHPETRVRPTGPLLFDRTQKFGYRDALDYRIVANWAIAEHKSQGTMQLLVNQGEHEHYFVFEASPPDAEARARSLFTALAAPQYPARSYGDSAGVGPTR